MSEFEQALIDVLQDVNNTLQRIESTLNDLDNSVANVSMAMVRR